MNDFFILGGIATTVHVMNISKRTPLTGEIVQVSVDHEAFFCQSFDSVRIHNVNVFIINEKLYPLELLASLTHQSINFRECFYGET